MIVVDACVAVKWFVVEPGSAEAARVLQSREGLVAPAHAVVELGRALLRHVREGTINRRQVEIAFDAFCEDVALVPTDELVRSAFDIADRHQVTIYDALYVAAALRHGCSLVTVDDRLIERLRRSPLETVLRDLSTFSPAS